MNTKQIFRQGLWTLVSLFLVAAIAFGQGTLKNGGTFRNTGTVSYKEVQNYNATQGGTIRNSGTINVTLSGGTKNFLNQNGASHTGSVYNYIGGIGNGTIVVGNNLDNNFAGSVFDNDSASGFSTIKVAGAVTNAGTFTTTRGRVWYNGGAQTVLTTTYGTLIADQTGAKTLAGTVTVNDTLRIDNSASVAVSTFQLDLKGLDNVAQNSATLSATSGTVRYNGDRDQTMIPATYLNLTLTGATAGHTKTSPGGLSFAASGSLSLSSNDTLEVSSGTLNLTNLVAGSTYTNGSGIRISSTSAPNFGSITSVGNFIYNSASAQSIAAATYANLTLRAAGTKAFPASTVAITGNYAIEGTVGSRDYTTNSNTFQFGGTSAQTISGLAETFHILQFAGSGDKTLGGSAFSANRLDVNSGSGTVVNNVTTVTLNGITNVGMTLASGTFFVNSAGKTMNITGDVVNDGNLTNDGTITVN